MANTDNMHYFTVREKKTNLSLSKKTSNLIFVRNIDSATLVCWSQESCANYATASPVLTFVENVSLRSPSFPPMINIVRY